MGKPPFDLLSSILTEVGNLTEVGLDDRGSDEGIKP
jgi:hypothetical protein